jgi:hypothetical protein
MDQTTFVELIKAHVRDSALRDALDILSSPPGRSPRTDWVEMSRWFHSLQESDKDIVSKIMKLSLDFGVFGFFCVLDGVRSIQSPSQLGGGLKLFYEGDEGRTLINDPEKEFLHDIFNS